MGEQRVSLVTDQQQMQKFIKQLINDVKALEYMLDNDWFESDIVRIGAEQEMALVEKDSCKPAAVAMEALAKMTDWEWVETELARFNLEINLTPHEFKNGCLSLLENEVNTKLEKIRGVLHEMDKELVLTGILPTLRKFDLGMHNLTPKKRYKALMEAINQQLLGNAYELRLLGIDELLVKHDSPLLEACNTSFQVHLQVSPNNFVQYYNIAQVLAAPVIAISANSPIVFGKRLWHESRIALFQQSLDTRSTHDHMRERSPRVNFGNGWLDKSIIEIYQEDIARFRVLISGDIEEDSLDMIKQGKVPNLRSLQVHNSTVYRWNRPCYGISKNGKPHLRIENRVLPAGPTVVDEVANAAFWLGAMIEMAHQYKDIREHIGYADARDNFGKASRYGIDTKFTWLNDEKITAIDLVLEKLIPMSRAGLRRRNINEEDIDKYLSIIQKRAEGHVSGARWQLRAFTKLKDELGTDEAMSVLTAAIIKNQTKNIPVAEWDLPKYSDLEDYKPTGLKVEEFMTTDLFTVQKDDIVDIVAEMMIWRKIRYMPVEDNKGNLIGLMTSRGILKHYNDKKAGLANESITVDEIMIKDPKTISCDETLYDAMQKMQHHKIGSLPVVKGSELVGIITEMDFLRISGRLIERLESKK